MHRLISLLFWTALTLGCQKHHSPSLPLPLSKVQHSGPDRTVVDIWRTREEGTKIYILAETGDGPPRLFMVDTGASVSVISPSLAQELQLAIRPARGELVGLGGSAPWNRAVIPELSIGEQTFRDVQVAVGVPGVPSKAGAVPLAGILGNNIWSHFVVSVDYVSNKLELAAPGTTDRRPNAQPLIFNGQHVRTTVKVSIDSDEGVQTEALLLEIDTGAQGMVISGHAPQALEASATEGLEPLFGIGAGDNLPASNFLQRTRRISIQGVEVGGHYIERNMDATWINFDGQATPLGPAGMPGLLGHQAFEGYRLVLDYPGGWVSLEPSTAKPEVHNIHQWALNESRCGPLRGCTQDQARVLRQAQYLHWLERQDDAAELLSDWWTGHPQDYITGIYYARLMRRRGQAAAALELLLGLPLEVLESEHELVAVINSLVLADRVPEAKALAEGAVEALPESPSARVAMADLQRSIGDFGGARRSIQRANLLDENPDGHLLRRAWISSLDGDLHATLTHVRRLVQLYPSGGVAPWFYAIQVAQTEETELFHDDILRARSRLHPGDGPLDFFAAAYRSVGDAEQARLLMEEGKNRDCSTVDSEISQSNCEAWYRALIHTELDLARGLIEAALAEEPHRAEFLDTLAVVLEAQGELPAARKAAHRAASMVPDDVYLLWQAYRLEQAASRGPGG